MRPEIEIREKLEKINNDLNEFHNPDTQYIDVPVTHVINRSNRYTDKVLMYAILAWVLGEEA